MNPSNSLLVGQIALELGFLTDEQLRSCLDLQAGQATARPIGTVLLESHFLTPERLAQVVAEQHRRMKESVPFAIATKAEAAFGRLLVKGGLVNEEHVNEALRAQQDFAERQVRKRLGELLVEAGRIIPQVVLQVLHQQGKTIRACTFCGAHYNVLLEVADRFPCRRCGMAMADTLATVRVDETAFLLPAVPLLPAV
ncbi:MAG TPA: hypothetical protein VF950_21270, partial [Planctomycetota bacterium]